MLRLFFSTQLDDHVELELHMKSFSALCLVVDCILSIKQGLLEPLIGSVRLRNLTSAFMTAHLACYGSVRVRPRYHW